MNNNMMPNYLPFPGLNPYPNQEYSQELRNLENRITNLEREVNRINNKLNRITNNYNDSYTNNYQSQRYNMM